MAAFVVTSRTVLMGTAITGTAPGPGVVTPSGVITSISDLSSYIVGGAEPTWASNMVDITNMGSLGYTTVIPGLTSMDDIVLEANSDQAASALYSIVKTTLGGIARPGSAPVYVDIKAAVAARSATNPSLLAAVYISKWMPFGGGVGSKAAAQLTLSVTGTFIDLTS